MTRDLRRLQRTRCALWIPSIALVSVCVAQSEARTWRVPQDAPTIQAGVDSAATGDDILVSPDVYEEHAISIRKGVRVHSTGGAGVTRVIGQRLDSVFVIEEVDGVCILEGLTIQGGKSAGGYGGGGIFALNSRLEVRSCTIAECEAPGGGGLLSIDCFVTLDDCTVVGNRAESGGGVLVASVDRPTGLTARNCSILNNDAFAGLCCAVAGGIHAEGEVAIIDCVVAGNRTGFYGSGAALFLVGDDMLVSGCTIVGNAGLWGPEDSIIEVNWGNLRLERNIVAFNTGSAMHCFTEEVSARCNDVFANSGGNELCGTDLGGNFAADPQFCDFDGGNYSLINTSPCLPGRHPDGAACGLVGALGTGCESTPIERTSWGRMKALYRP